MSAQELNEEAIAHLKRVLDANGFVIVPKKPTSEMLKAGAPYAAQTILVTDGAGRVTSYTGEYGAEAVYDAMVKSWTDDHS